jgi:hypothetical protein
MPTVDVTKVVKFLNVTPRRVQQLVKEGMPRDARGQYNPIKCGAWYVRYLQAAIEKKTFTAIQAALTQAYGFRAYTEKSNWKCPMKVALTR